MSREVTGDVGPGAVAVMVVGSGVVVAKVGPTVVVVAVKCISFNLTLVQTLT